MHAEVPTSWPIAASFTAAGVVIGPDHGRDVPAAHERCVMILISGTVRHRPSGEILTAPQILTFERGEVQDLEVLEDIEHFEYWLA